MIIEATALSSVPGQFSAALDGTVIVAKSRMPLLDGARTILAASNSTYELIMRHSGSTVDALITTVGVAARLTVHESGPGGRPRFVPITMVSGG
jgi:hypothetical protein